MSKSPPHSFAGKTVLVTGAGQGVGEAVATLMADRGAKAVAICGRDAAKLARTEAVLKERGADALSVPFDLADVAACQAFADRAADAFGGIDVLVNAAGVTDRGTIDDTDPAMFDLQFAINARAPFFLMQRVIPSMRRAGGGTIVNVVSIVAHGGPPFIVAYCGAKAALAAMTRNVANAVLRDRIRVNGLNMGWTSTPQEHVVQTRTPGKGADWQAKAGAGQPFGRLLLPAEVARAVAFLASDESGLMTGAVMDFDQQVIGTMPAEET